ncbi:MAG: rod shape-determining protein MreC [Pseudomonadota bacterium]
MALGNMSDGGLWQTTRRVLLGLMILAALALFAFWRADSPRIERLRMQLTDMIAPSFDWTVRPFAGLVRMVEDFESYTRVYEQNRELRRELQRLRGWREVAAQLEQRNARLRALNNVRLSPRLGFVTGEVMADTNSPFLQSGLLNVGQVDGVVDGSAVVDDLGLVGRISGVGAQTSRVIFLTDLNSRVPAQVRPSGLRAIVSGDTSVAPRLDFVDAIDSVSAGDRIVTSGDGGVLPPDLLIGQVVFAPDGRLRVRIAADYRRLEYLRVLKFGPDAPLDGPGELIVPRDRSAAAPVEN